MGKGRAKGCGAGRLPDLDLGEPLRDRSGDARLDQAIERYLRQVRQDLLSDPEYTTDMCSTVSEDFLDFLRSRGMEAYPATETADDHGYLDRLRDGSGWRWHTLVVVPVEDQSFAVDFTAAQYGYTALPLVRRLPYALRWPEYELPREAHPETVEPLPWQRSW